MKLRSLRGRALISGAIVEDAVVTFDERIHFTGEPGLGETADRFEGLLVPGFIDIHVHGAAGADFMDGTVQAAETIARFHAQHGTVAMAGTTLSASSESIGRAISAIAEAATRRATHCAEIVAVHLEGPYLNPARAGAQHLASIRPPDLDETQRWLDLAGGLRCLMTVAPEVEGAFPLLVRFREAITFSLGHTEATYAKAIEAFDHGATHVTHLFNAMAPLHHREPGLAGAVLVNDQVTAEVIADGLHLHRALLRLLGLTLSRRLVLVTDAMRACGMPFGTYKLYHHDVVVDENGARLNNGVLAGSVLTMANAVRNMVELAGLPLELTIPMASLIPARILGIDHRKGRIQAGYDADLLVLSSKLEPARVFIRGAELPHS